MAIIKNKKKKKINSSIPYDQQSKIEKIKLLCVIVNRSQANFYINTFNDAGVSCVFDVFGEGTAPKEMQEIMGIIDSRKSLIVCIVKESLIDKITKLNENCQLIDQGKQELMIKQQQLQERTQENLMLKKDLKKVKQGFDREKTSIIIGKDKQIEYLQTKLRSAEKYQFNEEKEKKEKFKYLNMYKEMKLEIQTLLTENNRLACEVAKLTARDYAINQNYKKVESALVNARKTIQFLVNTPAFKEVKKMFFNMENVDMLTSVGNEINTSKENGYTNTNSSVDVK